MSARPALLFYCQHSLGLGHLARSLALCRALAERFRVVLLSGGTLPAGIAAPAGVEVVALPPLAMAPGGQLVSDGGRAVEEARTLRRERIMAAARSVRPEVVVIELFPFGRRKFAGEVVPLLEEARGPRGERPLRVCSLRDILVGRGERQAHHDERAAKLANRHLDAILVHSDPRFARLDESFAPRTPLRVPVHYTGFVTGATRSHPRSPGGPIVVSAGGGRVGEPLVRAAIAAHALLPRGTRMRAIAGPFMPEDAWRSLQHAASGRDGLELVRAVDDLDPELRAASASVSQCGYNTALEVVRSGVPALAVPFAAPGEDEQIRRARRLETLGALRVLDADRLEPRALAAEIEALRTFEPRAPELDMDGAGASAALLDRLLQAQEVAA